MSDIKIQPSATGSATVTLTAPATCTARTVTLPDGTGSLIADNGSGSVGIGTSSPDGTVHIRTASAGSVTANADADDLVVENSGHTGINILSPDASRSAIQLGHTSDNLEMQIRHDGATSLTQVISDDPITFNVTDGSESARVTADGITFQGDTAAANALDDYEEGDWTPTLTGSGTISHRVGKYVKIGNQIMVQGEIRTTSYTNSGSTDVKIGGLPYSSFNESNYNFAASITPITGFNSPANQGLVGYVSANQTDINLYGVNFSTGANYDFLQTGEMGTTVEVFFAVHYRTN